MKPRNQVGIPRPRVSPGNCSGRERESESECGRVRVRDRERAREGVCERESVEGGGRRNEG